jgi:hypothetical protein
VQRTSEMMNGSDSTRLTSGSPLTLPVRWGTFDVPLSEMLPLGSRTAAQLAGTPDDSRKRNGIRRHPGHPSKIGRSARKGSVGRTLHHLERWPNLARIGRPEYFPVTTHLARRPGWSERCQRAAMLDRWIGQTIPKRLLALPPSLRPAGLAIEAPSPSRSCVSPQNRLSETVSQ